MAIANWSPSSTTPLFRGERQRKEPAAHTSVCYQTTRILLPQPRKQTTIEGEKGQDNGLQLLFRLQDSGPPTSAEAMAMCSPFMKDVAIRLSAVDSLNKPPPSLSCVSSPPLHGEEEASFHWVFHECGKVSLRYVPAKLT